MIHCNATVEMNGVKKGVVIYTVSSLTKLPPDERLLTSFGVQTGLKKTNRYHCFNKMRQISKENIGNLGTRKQQTKDENSNHRKNQYNAVTWEKTVMKTLKLLIRN